MKTIKNVSVTALLIALLFSGGTSFAQKTEKTNEGASTDYHVMSRMDVSPRPAAFLPTQSVPVNGAYTEYVVTVANRVLNGETIMLKKVSVQSIGDEAFSPWQLLCDEGGHTYEQAAPNPLSYMTAGISSSLLTSVEQAIMVMGLDVENAKVEAKVFYRFTDPMTPDWKGYTDKVIVNILIDSKEPAKEIEKMKELAIQSWAIGACLMTETPVDAQFAYNTKIWDTDFAQHGRVAGSDSYDNEMKITSKGSKPKPETFKVGEDVSMEKFTNPFVFEVIGLSESANDIERPYLHKVKIRAIQENYASWDIYADDSRGFKGEDKAPSSNDYFTAGTSLCLMSQLTGWAEVFKHKGVEFDDYCVEHQFNFQVNDYMTPAAKGSVDEVTTRILIKGGADEKVMNDFAIHALGTCFAGEAVTGKTETEIGVYQNGKRIK